MAVAKLRKNRRKLACFHLLAWLVHLHAVHGTKRGSFKTETGLAFFVRECVCVGSSFELVNPVGVCGRASKRALPLHSGQYLRTNDKGMDAMIEREGMKERHCQAFFSNLQDDTCNGASRVVVAVHAYEVPPSSDKQWSSASPAFKYQHRLIFWIWGPQQSVFSPC